MLDVLLIDDQRIVAEAVRRMLLSQTDIRFHFCQDAERALEEVGRVRPTLILLDLVMPGVDGLDIIRSLQLDPMTFSVPIIVLSSKNDAHTKAESFRAGARDFLVKLPDEVELVARIRYHCNAYTTELRLYATMKALTEERQNARRLLLNILPARVADELQEGRRSTQYHEDVTICFTDFVGFTLSTEYMPAEHLIDELHAYFTAFDNVMGRYNLEKLKTIGDSYMFASGLHSIDPANPVKSVLAAMELMDETQRLSQRPGAQGWQLRIGLHTGPVIAGVVGIRKFAYDVWGNSVNLASRMESSGVPREINLSAATYQRVKEFILCEPRGHIMTKDKREVEMFLVRGIQPALIADGSPNAFKSLYRQRFDADLPSFPGSRLGRMAT